jgi:hypothetical protein
VARRLLFRGATVVDKHEQRRRDLIELIKRVTIPPDELELHEEDERPIDPWELLLDPNSSKSLKR